VARDDLPASITGTAIVCPEDLAADRAEHAKEQVTRGLAYVGISGIVQHSQYTFECAGWVGAVTSAQPFLFSASSSVLPEVQGQARAGFVSCFRLGREVTVQEHCRQRSTTVLDNGPLHLGVSLCLIQGSTPHW
jgi:hypothetical protein